jgi:hypothetical protein
VPRLIQVLPLTRVITLAVIATHLTTRTPIRWAVAPTTITSVLITRAHYNLSAAFTIVMFVAVTLRAMLDDDDPFRLEPDPSVPRQVGSP